MLTAKQRSPGSSVRRDLHHGNPNPYCQGAVYFISKPLRKAYFLVGCQATTSKYGQAFAGARKVRAEIWTWKLISTPSNTCGMNRNRDGELTIFTSQMFFWMNGHNVSNPQSSPQWRNPSKDQWLDNLQTNTERRTSRCSAGVSTLQTITLCQRLFAINPWNSWLQTFLKKLYQRVWSRCYFWMTVCVYVCVRIWNPAQGLTSPPIMKTKRCYWAHSVENALRG